MADHQPIHPYTGQRAVAVLPSGRVVWPVAGGSHSGSGGQEGGQGGGGGEGAGTGGEPGRTFTQADIDRIVQDRVARERAKFSDYDDLKTKAQRLKEAEDADKTEQDRLREQLDAAKADGGKATAAQLRLEVALDKAPEGMPLAKLRKLAKRLQGSTKEELEADAVELFADDAPGDGSGQQGGSGQDGRAPRSRPAELREGSGATNAETEVDVKKVADEVLGDR